MSRFVQRITVVSYAGPNLGQNQQIYKKKKKRKKIDRWMRPFEKSQRRMLQAANAFTDEALGRHNRSNRKRRNGWLRDYNLNAARAFRKGLKKVR